MKTETVYLADGTSMEVPKDYADDWRMEVQNRDTKLGLADWYRHNVLESE